MTCSSRPSCEHLPRLRSCRCSSMIRHCLPQPQQSSCEVHHPHILQIPTFFSEPDIPRPHYWRVPPQAKTVRYCMLSLHKKRPKKFHLRGATESNLQSGVYVPTSAISDCAAFEVAASTYCEPKHTFERPSTMSWYPPSFPTEFA